ncbi:MAG: YraN family protein [bacterium]|nr:YraN family protein [bacterium]
MKTGAAGENLAVKYLENKGYITLERNYRFHHKEVDVICEKKGVIVFVEVKSNINNDFGEPIEKVDRNKASNIIDVAQAYLLKRKLFGKCNVRFDVIGVKNEKIQHIEDAFRE